MGPGTSESSLSIDDPPCRCGILSKTGKEDLRGGTQGLSSLGNCLPAAGQRDVSARRSEAAHRAACACGRRAFPARSPAPRQRWVASGSAGCADRSCGFPGWPAGQFPLAQRHLQFLAAFLRCRVVLHLVKQGGIQTLGARADRPVAPAVDESHQGADVSRAPGEQVVRQVIGDHPRILAGQDKPLLDRQQGVPPVRPAVVRADQEGGHAEPGGPASRLGEHGVLVDIAFIEQAAVLQADPDHDHADRELVGDVLEVVADLEAILVLPSEEVQVVDFTDRGNLCTSSDLRLFRDYMSTTAIVGCCFFGVLQEAPSTILVDGAVEGNRAGRCQGGEPGSAMRASRSAMRRSWKRRLDRAALSRSSRVRLSVVSWRTRCLSVVFSVVIRWMASWVHSASRSRTWPRSSPMRARWAVISAWAAFRASSAFSARSRQVASRSLSWSASSWIRCWPASAMAAETADLASALS